jgi:CHAT domain-containing protein
VELWRNGQVRSVTVRPGSLGIGLSPQAPLAALRARWDGEEAVRASRGSGKFVPLPGTRREVLAISQFFEQPKLLLGSEASEQVLDELARADRLKRYRYLHLATHGVAIPDHGLRSFLALAQDRLPDPLTVPPPGQKLFDGRLTAADILHAWALDADLVTLSACETGLGQPGGGEGYVGFAQALFLAGARSLVLSQWKVDDQATALLMVRFYQNLLGQREGLTQPLGKAAALAEAKRWLRSLTYEQAERLGKELGSIYRGEVVPATAAVTEAQPYAHPYYWAGFILIGDPGGLTEAIPVLADVSKPEAAGSGIARWWLWLMGGTVVLLALGGGVWWRHRSTSRPRPQG